MHDRPTAGELLTDIAELLEERIVPRLDGHDQHHVRVAANLCRIIERELVLAPAHAAEEESQLRALLPDAPPDTTLGDLHGVLAARLRDGADEQLTAAAWPVLVDITRRKLSVTKPGYDDHDFAGETTGESG